MAMKPVLVAGLVAAAAFAQRGPGGRGGFPNLAFRALDADRDGSVSAAEMKNAAAALASLDANHDGALTEDELRPRLEGRGGPGGGPPREQPAATSEDLVNNLLAFDANSDGKLEKSEVPERMQGIFARGDQNKDGTLTADELKSLAGRQQDPARQGMPMDPLRAALDADRDGTISQAELNAAPGAIAGLDKNGDGVVSEDEVRPPMMRGGPGGRGGNPAEMFRHILEENDSNRDGKLAVSELPERMREFLGRADTNKDGFLTLEEMQAARREERH